MSVIVALLLQAAAPAAAQMELVCGGAGTASRTETDSAYATNSNGASAWGTVERRRSEAFQDQVDLRIDGDASRIRLPRVMLPPIHGGDAGWFKLKNLAITDDAITGSAAVNPLNNPKVRVDRRTGVISIDGKAGHYSGQCDKIDPAAPTRRF